MNTSRQRTADSPGYRFRQQRRASGGAWLGTYSNTNVIETGNDPAPMFLVAFMRNASGNAEGYT